VKIKHGIITLVLLFICTLAIATEAYANRPEDFLIRDYTIQIDVKNLPDALARLNTMPGFDLNTFVNNQSGWGSIERRVNVRDLDRFMSDMHSLGDVTASWSHTRNVFSMVTDLRSEHRVRSTEHGRLMELLYEVETMAQFAAIENRLVQVISEMERIRGRLNNLEFETGTARLTINLSVVDPEEEIPELGPFARIGQAFMESAETTLSVLQQIVILFLYVSLPLGFFVIVGGSILWIVIRKDRRKGGIKHEKDETIPDENNERKGDEDNES